MIPIRLTTGTDLKIYLSNLAKDETIFPKDTGYFIATCVGSLTKANLRMAGAKSFLELSEPMEILSLVGTACTDGVHFHISLSKETGEVVGGHLMDGCLIASTAEIIIMKVEGYSLNRKFDDCTGYPELVVTKK